MRRRARIRSQARCGARPLAALLVILFSLVNLGPSRAEAADDAPAEAPSDVGPADRQVQKWVREAAGDEYAVRRDAVVALGTVRRRADVEWALPALLRAANDDDWYIRLRAVESLAAIAPHEPVVRKALAAAAADPVIRVRDAAVQALGGPAARPGAPARRYGNARLPAAPPRPSAGGAAGAGAAGASAGGSPLKPSLVDELLAGGRPADALPNRLDPETSRAVFALFAVFRDKNDSRGERAAELLARFGADALPVFVGALDEKDAAPVIRRRALAGLVALGDKAAPALPALKDLLRDPLDPNLDLALRALAQLGGAPEAGGDDPELIRTLLDVARDPRVKDRGQALLTAVRVAPASAVVRREVTRALQGRVRPLLPAAVEAAERLGPDAEVAWALSALLRDPDAGLRVRAAHALARIDATGWGSAEAMLEAVREKDYAVRVALAARVRKAPEQVLRIEPRLAELARRDPDEQVRLGARNALYELRTGAAGDAGRLPPEDAARVDAIVELGSDVDRTNVDRVVAVLVRAVERERGFARLKAVESLASALAYQALGDGLRETPASQVATALAAALGDDSPAVRAETAATLATVWRGRAAPDPALLAALRRMAERDPDPVARRAAAIAAATLGGSAPPPSATHPATQPATRPAGG